MIKNILNSLLFNGYVRNLKNNEKIKGFKFKALNGSSGIVEYKGITYNFIVLNDIVHVETEATIKNKYNNNFSLWCDAIHDDELTYI